MILFVHIVKQEADTEKSGQLGDQLVKGTLKKNHSSQRNQQSTSKGLLQNILRIFSQNTLQSTFVMDRNGILRSYPILSDLRYPKSLVVIVPYTRVP